MFPKTLLTIYNALIKPLFDYCDVVWGNLNKTLTARLQKLQNRAARIITRKGYAGYDERCADIRQELRWDDLETIRKKHLAIMNKVVNNKAPGYLNKLLKKATVVMRYERVTVDFSSPNITPNLLKAVVFLLLEQRYGTPSHIILELLPLSLLLKNK